MLTSKLFKDCLKYSYICFIAFKRDHVNKLMKQLVTLQRAYPIKTLRDIDKPQGSQLGVLLLLIKTSLIKPEVVLN